MKFHLNYTPARASFNIDHHTPVLLIGSCFAENIGKRMVDLKFKVSVNPDGILFNPLSIAQSLRSALEGTAAQEELFVNRDGVHCSYLHHSSVNAASTEDLVAEITNTRKNTSAFLNSAKYLILTFGSAFVYRHKLSQQVVANCHKQNENLFEKKILSFEEIISAYDSLIKDLNKRHPTIKIIFTVSPVKYLRDGLEGNSISKATLLVSIQELIKKHPHCFYFPAYELVSDDLRDYRFYKEDLAHPTEAAIDYVWKKFSGTFFNDHTVKLTEEITRLNNALSHRPLHGESVEDEKLNDFIKDRKDRIRSMDSALKF